MATALLSPPPVFNAFTNAGVLGAGYKLYTYAANTTTPQATYTNRAGTVPNANPIILDARGEAVIYLTAGVVYDYVLKTDQDVTVWTREDVIADAGDANAVSYTASGTGAFPRPLQGKAGERPSVLDYIDPDRHAGIAAATDLNDVSAGFNNAAAAHLDLEIPAGTYYLMDAVMVQQGARIRGAGRRKTILRIPSTFNMSADGVFVFPATESGPEVSDLTIEFMDQPDSATAGDYVQYPPAFYAQACPRFTLGRLRIAMCWDGIDMKGNSGGAVIDDLELSMFNIGIDIDGSLDSVKISKLHLWPFSGTNAPLTANNRTVFAAAKGINCARCDDFHLSDSLIFSVVNGCFFYSSASGRTFGNIVNTDFDDRGGLVMSAGDLSASACVFTQGKNDARLVYVTGGTLQISSSRMRGDVINASAAAYVEIVGGEVTISDSMLNGINTNKQFVYVENARVVLDGNRYSRDPNIGFSTGFVRVGTGARVSITGGSCSSLGTGASLLALIDTDNGTVITGVDANGWGAQAPTARSKTIITNNIGLEHDRFAGGADSAGVSTGLPSGWTCARAGVGNYTVTHSLGLSHVRDMVFNPVAEGTAFAVWDVTNSNSTQARIRTYDAAGAAVDVAYSFLAIRRR